MLRKTPLSIAISTTLALAASGLSTAAYAQDAELEELKLELLKREGEVRLAQEALADHEARGSASGCAWFHWRQYSQSSVIVGRFPGNDGAPSCGD